MNPLATLDQVSKDAPAAIAAASTVAELEALESALLGKESGLGVVRRSLGAIDASERPAVGARLNEVTTVVKEALSTRRAVLIAAEDASRLGSDGFDVTLEAVSIPVGTLHLINQVIDEVTEIFAGLGYRVAEGPEAELAWYNFDALNTPKTHPARLESDTMYLDWGDPADEVLLRTQTSPVQARYMESHDPPVYLVAPGRTYRTDTIDATHLPVFHQIEGLAVDVGITLGDLKGTLAHFAREFFGSSATVRLRPSFFPFTEPSAELDVSCFVCQGNDPSCRVCGGGGWLEMLGCGMVDPNVLETAGYDSGTLSGFAFGVGVERLAMVRHGIDSIKNFIENDVRFLGQFR